MSAETLTGIAADQDPSTLRFPTILQGSGQAAACPVAFISTEASEQRRIHARASGIPEAWVDGFFPATDLTSMDAEKEGAYAALLDSDAFRERYGRRITPPELGCALSHRRVYQEMVDRDLPIALVLEDDVVPCAGYMETLEQIVSGVLRLAPRERSFVCHLGVPPHWTKKLFPRPAYVANGIMPKRLPGLKVLPGVQSLWWTHAYIVSQAAARRILEAEKNMPILADDWAERRRRGVLNVLLLSESVLFCQELGVESLIDTSGFRSVKRKGGYALRRVGMRGYYLKAKRRIMRKLPFLVL